MSFEGLYEFFRAALPGILTTLALLPITSDLLREKFFGPKSRRIEGARNELFKVLKEIFFSGQHIDDATYQKLSQNIAEKYKITPSLLGDKDNAISSLMKMVNLTEGLPKNVERMLSDSLKREYSDYESTPAMGYESSDSNEYKHSYVDDFEEILINKGNAYTEDYQGYNIIEDEGTQRRSTLLASYCSLLLGIVVAVITFSLDIAVWARMIQILPALLSFLLCISMLVSLIDAKVLKDVEYFRKLVYKIIVLLVFLVIEIVVSII